MPRSIVWVLYAACVLVWSSTWVVIAVGLEDVAPFFGAGIRFTLAGVGVLVAAALLRRSLRTDVLLAALVGVLPFATSYGLIYWAEQYVTSGLAAVLESATIEGGLVAEKLGTRILGERLSKVIPVIGAVSGGALNYLAVRAVAKTTIRYYESLIDPALADEIWQEGDREHA